MKFLVLTSCDDFYSDLQELTSSTIISYCQKHGYQYEINRIKEKERPPAWYKVQEVLRSFNKNIDYVIWIDTDAAIINQKYRLEDFVEDNKDFYFSCNWAAMNSGVFMMSNSQVNRDFLNLVWEQVQFIFDPWWEQKAMIHLLETGKYPYDRIKEIPEHIFNSEVYSRGCFVYHISEMSKQERIKKFRKIL